PMMPPVQQTRMDTHTAEYWARQLRIGAWVALAVTAIGGVRIALDWPAAERRWLIAVGVVLVAQAATLRLPWSRLLRDHRIRAWLLLWWLAEPPVLLLFGLGDPKGLTLYLPGAVLLLISAAAIWSPTVVVLIGTLAAAGYGVLLHLQAGTDPVTSAG